MIRLARCVVLVLAAGCGSPEPASEPPPASPSAPSWIVTARGAGPIRVGMTLSEAEEAAGTTLTGTDRDGECTFLRLANGPEGLMFMGRDGHIARIDVVQPGVPTDRQVEVGTTESLVRDAYGRSVVQSPHKYTSGHYLTVSDGPAHNLVFETDGKRVTRYRVGRLPEVEWVEGCG